MQLTLTELTSENRFSREYKSAHFVDSEYDEECFWIERRWITFSDVKKVGKEHKPRFIIERGFKQDDEWFFDDIVFFKREEADTHLEAEIGEAEWLRKKGLCFDFRMRYTHKVVKEGDKYVKGERVV